MDLWYHSPAEYKKLDKLQKQELFEWRQKKGGKSNSNNKNSNVNATISESKIVAAVAKEIKKQKAAEEADDKTEEDFKLYILSVVNGAASNGKQATETAISKPIPRKASNLNSIVG